MKLHLNALLALSLSLGIVAGSLSAAAIGSDACNKEEAASRRKVDISPLLSGYETPGPILAPMHTVETVDSSSWFGLSKQRGFKQSFAEIEVFHRCAMRNNQPLKGYNVCKTSVYLPVEAQDGFEGTAADIAVVNKHLGKPFKKSIGPLENNEVRSAIISTFKTPENNQPILASAEEKVCFFLAQKELLPRKESGRPLRILAEDRSRRERRAVFLSQWQCKTPYLCNGFPECSIIRIREGSLWIQCNER